MKLSTPATRVRDAYGGVRKAARALGLSPSSVSRWNHPNHGKGTVPQDHWDQIMRETGLKLKDLHRVGQGSASRRSSPS